MKDLDQIVLDELQGGGWLSDFGGGMACGLAIGGAGLVTGGLGIPLAIATCLWALG
jgi:hypothetical protein